MEKIIPHADVGYETGRRYPNSTYPGYPGYGSGGVYTSTGVGVVLGDSKPAGTPIDQEVIVTELSKKSLPDGQTGKPVAGYLYFRIDRKTQQDRNTRYSLEFDLRDKTVTLPLSN